MNSTNVYSRRQFVAMGLGTAASVALLGIKPLSGQQPAQKQDFAFLTLKQAADLVRRRAASPVELTEACLSRIDKHNAALNAFITVTRDQALASAREMEAEIQRGRYRGPLHGIPIAIKDNIDTAGVRTTAATGALRDRFPAEDAEVIRRLKNAGAVFLGKLNMMEIAAGGSSAISHFGAVHNPWAIDRVPGGSSGGSGAAVAAGLCYGALGTDTAGSVRIPASYCGLVGLKPTYGRVSIRGVIPLSWTLDHVGPLTRSVEDAALMLQVLAGYDEADPTTEDVPVPDYSRGMRQPTSRLRVGVPRVPFFNTLNPEVEKAVNDALEVIRRLTATMNDVTELPQTTPSVIGVESAVYHAEQVKGAPELYSEPMRGNLQRNINAPVEGYARALLAIAQVRRDIRKVFGTVDVLVTPTMPDVPITIAQAATVNVSTRNTSPFNGYGLPTITVPCGFTASGLPIGLQIAAAPFAESTVLALAQAYEQATQWHNRHPNL